MTSWARWCAVLLGLVVFSGGIWAVRAMPADDEAVSAAALRERVQDSSAAAYSGYVETLGTLQMPVTDDFTDVGALFGEGTRMRVWWRGGDDWRVDKLLEAGETDLVHDASGTTEWSYERARANRSIDPEIRLPRTADLLPPALGHRALEDADPDELTRVGADRVAGRDALGLRVTPASSRSSIDHVTMWADRETGVPLRVEVYADPTGPAVFTSEFREFSADTPEASLTAFRPPPTAEVRFDDVLDIADAANQFAEAVPPADLVGLAKSDRSRGAVGFYGTGITQVLAVPLWDRAAEPLREQLGVTVGSLLVAEGTYLEVDPLGILLTDLPDGSGWLVAGTVSQATLREAARELEREAVYDHHDHGGRNDR